MMRFIVLALFVLIGQRAALAAPINAPGPAALALAAVMAQPSPLVSAYNKRVIARLFRGNTNFGFTPNTAIPVAADSVQSLLDGPSSERDQRNGARRRRHIRGRCGFDHQKSLEDGLHD